MFVLIVGCGRVGSAIAKRMIKQGHEVSVLDESEEAHALPDHDLDQTWEDSGGRFTVGTALEVAALDAAGLQQADAVVCSTAGANTNLARELIEEDHEVTVIAAARARYLTVEKELEHAIQHGDASELWVLERAGIVRADMVVAVTGDDEDNMLISQVAKEKYLVEHTI